MNKDEKKMIDITEDLKDLSVEETRKMAEEFDAKLNKAVKYGLDQYAKGYADGKKETAREILQELWDKRLSFSDLQFAICDMLAEYDIDLEEEK